MTNARETGLARLVLVYAAMALALSPVVATLVVAPARSGPFCPENCVFYPFADIAAFYPVDYWWMYAMLAACVALLVLGACAVSLAPDGAALWARIGNNFAVVGAVVLAICYFLQIEVVQPSVLAGETDGIAVLTQYNEHGVFIALEDLGYLALALGLAGIAAGLRRLGRLFGAAFWAALGGAALVVAAFVVVTVSFGVARSYYFEVFAILIDWIVMAVSGSLLAIGAMRLRLA